jgi:hypothetical protein
MRLRSVLDAVLVGAASAVALLVAAPVTSATPVQIVLVVALTFAAAALFAAPSSAGAVAVCSGAAAEKLFVNRHLTRATVAPLTVSLRLRC